MERIAIETARDRRYHPVALRVVVEAGIRDRPDVRHLELEMVREHDAPRVLCPRQERRGIAHHAEIDVGGRARQRAALHQREATLQHDVVAELDHQAREVALEHEALPREHPAPRIATQAIIERHAEGHGGSYVRFIVRSDRCGPGRARR